jgi:hypothetical protein
MHEAMKEELRQVLTKYTELGLMPIFVSDAFGEIDAEARMGPMEFIYEGDDPA